jgi:hypothetical protein
MNAFLDDLVQSTGENAGELPPMVLLLASEGALSPSARVWGTGAWLQPEDREALDWLTLVRFLGWQVDVCVVDHGGALATRLAAHARVIIIACDPDTLNDHTIGAISSYLSTERVLLVSRGAAQGSAMAKLGVESINGGSVDARSIEWRGPGPHGIVFSKNPFEVRRLSVHCDAVTWASAGDVPLVTARACGRGLAATLAIQPSDLRDADPAGTALLKRLLTWGTCGAVAWLDFEHTLVLRMDDPGGAQNVYSRTWSYPKLNAADWGAIAADLSERHARISLGYISGWVDDADEKRGLLTIGGHAVLRCPGAVYPSPLVRYEDVAGHAPGTVHDYQSEFRGIQDMRRSGIADVELHGYTHMHPDTDAWCRAPDRFESWPSTGWFREFGRAAVPGLATRSADDHPLSRALAVFREYFDAMPTTLISPGDQWTDDTLERAIDLGLRLVDSYYLAIRHQERFCWAQHVCAPYLNRPDSTWFASGLPVVGYFHDYDVAIEGVGWMTQWLDRWQEAGARRLIDFRELASAVGCRLTLEGDARQLRLTVDRDAIPAPVRPIPVRLRAERLPSRLTVRVNGQSTEVDINLCQDGTGLALLPVS